MTFGSFWFTTMNSVVVITFPVYIGNIFQFFFLIFQNKFACSLVWSYLKKNVITKVKHTHTQNAHVMRSKLYIGVFGYVNPR